MSKVSKVCTQCGWLAWRVRESGPGGITFVTCFGLSPTYKWAVFARFMWGLGCGNTAVMKVWSPAWLPNLGNAAQLRSFFLLVPPKHGVNSEMKHWFQVVYIIQEVNSLLRVSKWIAMHLFFKNRWPHEQFSGFEETDYVRMLCKRSIKQLNVRWLQNHGCK